MQNSPSDMLGIFGKIKSIVVDALPGVIRKKKERVPSARPAREEGELSPEIKEALDKAENETFNTLRSFVGGIYTLPPYPHSICSPGHVWTGICVGDIAGSCYEGRFITGTEDEIAGRKARPVTEDRFIFTDDSVMSAAIMKATEEMVNSRPYKALLPEMTPDNNAWREWIRKLEEDIDPSAVYARKMKEYAKRYPDAGYGTHFYEWAVLDREGIPDGSFGDGSAMRSGTIGACFDDIRKVITFAYFSALPTHSHPEGIKGAVVTAVAVWMAAHGYSREDIISYASYHYDKASYMPHAAMTVSEMLGSVVPNAKLLSVACQYAVPEAFAALNSSTDFETSLTETLRYSCDTDTVMAITGGIAAALYGNIEYQGISGEKWLEIKDAKELLSDRI